MHGGKPAGEGLRPEQFSLALAIHTQISVKPDSFLFTIGRFLYMIVINFRNGKRFGIRHSIQRYSNGWQ